MKYGSSTNSQIARRLALLAIPLCGLFTGLSPAQSVSDLGTSPATPAAKAPAKQKEAPAAATTSTPTDTPSRFIGETDIAAYIQLVSGNFGINKQETDSFGQFQDPTKRPIVKPKATKSRKRIPMKKTPFSDIVRLIKITTIMPADKKFLVGTRSFKLGDRIPISYRGRTISAEVASVDARSVKIRNTQTGETGTISLNLLPIGMTPGTGGIMAPGMVPDSNNAPLQLESSEF